jgi:hypothetical protein
MRQALKAFILGDVVVVLLPVLVAIIAFGVAWIGRVPITLALVPAAVVAFALFALRSLLRGKLLASEVVVGIWLLTFIILALMRAPGRFVLVLGLMGMGAVVFMWIRRFEF